MREGDTEEVLGDARKRFARVIRQVLTGDIAIDDGIEVCEQIAGGSGCADESMVRAIHALRHYRDDRDARQKDAAYAELQIRGLRAIAERFSVGLPLATGENHYWRR